MSYHQQKAGSIMVIHFIFNGINKIKWNIGRGKTFRWEKYKWNWNKSWYSS